MCRLPASITRYGCTSPFRFDDWLLYTTDSPWSGHSRGFNRGQIFSRDGRLIASVTQEGLIRLKD